MINAIATRPHRAASRAQLLAAGVPAGTIGSRVRRRRLDLVHRGVYRVGPIESPRFRAMAAALACGARAVVSHASAAVIHRAGSGCRRSRRGHYHAACRTAPAPGRSAAPGPWRPRAHRRDGRGRHSGHYHCADGVRPCGHAGPTLIDAAARAGAAGAPDCRQRLVELGERFPRRVGVPALREQLNADAPPPFTRSVGEQRVREWLARAQLPGPESNVRVAGFEVDLLFRRQRLILEMDGCAWHGDRRSFEQDRRRDATLAAQGYQVIRLAWQQIEREPEATMVLIGQALALAEARLRAPVAG